MGGTVVKQDFRLPGDRICVVKVPVYPGDIPVYQGVLRKPGIVAFDAPELDIDFEALRAGLIPERRKFKDAWRPEGDPAPRVRQEITKACSEIDRFARIVFPDFQLGERFDSWRPMITGGDFEKPYHVEPLHFDNWVDEVPTICGFLNVDTKPRIYDTSYTFQDLCKRAPDKMKYLVKQWRKYGNGVSQLLREDCWRDDKEPMKRDNPVNRIEFAPGTLYFLYTRTISHQVIYGGGALMCSWQAPGSNLERQEEAIERLLKI